MDIRETFRCGHSREIENCISAGIGRVKCKKCHYVWRKQYRARKTKLELKRRVIQAPPPNMAKERKAVVSYLNLVGLPEAAKAIESGLHHKITEPA
jgi:hypothetical protein